MSDVGGLFSLMWFVWAVDCAPTRWDGPFENRALSLIVGMALVGGCFLRADISVSAPLLPLICWHVVGWILQPIPLLGTVWKIMAWLVATPVRLAFQLLSWTVDRLVWILKRCYCAVRWLLGCVWRLLGLGLRGARWVIRRRWTVREALVASAGALLALIAMSGAVWLYRAAMYDGLRGKVLSAVAVSSDRQEPGVARAVLTDLSLIVWVVAPAVVTIDRSLDWR